MYTYVVALICLLIAYLLQRKQIGPVHCQSGCQTHPSLAALELLDLDSAQP